MQDDGSKRCSKCGEVKPLGDFYRDATRGDGYRSHCKTCCKAAEKRTPQQRATSARAWYWANKERRQQYVKENLHLFREQARRRRADPAKLAHERALERERRRGDPDYVARVRAWQDAHPDYMRQAYARKAAIRRARRADAFVEDVDPLVLLERDDGTCGICGGDVDPLNFQTDHVVPLSRGGEHSYANTQPVHPRCNARKGNRLVRGLVA